MIGVIWGTLWATIAMIAGTIIGVTDPSDIGSGDEPIALTPVIWIAGFVCGSVFAALLATLTPTTWFEDVTRFRIASCGALIAAAFPIVMGKGVLEMLVIVPVDVIAALLSVVLAAWISTPPVARC